LVRHKCRQPCCFFFSSRRRHTRFSRDWSSDVCSSDLASHLVVFSAIDNVEKFENENLSQLPEGAVSYYYQLVKPLGEAGIRNWMQHQVYLSLGFFLAGCASMGIDSTPMEGIQPDKYNEILKYDG